MTRIGRYKTYTITVTTLIYAVSSVFLFTGRVSAANAIVFPVIGHATFVNDFHYARGSRVHNAIDVMAGKGQKLVAVVDGTITRVNYPQPSWGYAIYIRDAAGYKYGYLHMNDDNPGTNDGMGGGMFAYAPDMKVGNKVKKGQHIGWVGDSGNSNGVPHLHFEMYEPSGRPVNPYESLLRAPRLTKPLLYPALEDEVLPYGRSYKGGFSIEMGNFDADPASEYIIGSGPGLETTIQVRDDDDTLLKNIYVYAPSFRGGVYAGTADIDGDGTDEIVTGAAGGGLPLVKIYEPNGTEVGRFYAYDSNSKMGVIVTGGDTDGDGDDEIITSLGRGGAPRIKVYTPAGSMVSNFYAYGEAAQFGVDVTSADVVGTTADEIITSPLRGGVPKVKIFDGAGVMSRQFYAYSQQFVGGVRVSAGDVRTGVAGTEILTVPASSAGQHIKIFTGLASYIEGEKFLEEWWIGYHDIAAGNDLSKAATGVNRRVSIRDGIE